MRFQNEHCIIVGRDGVINRRVINGHVARWNQFEFLPRALDALRMLAENDFTTLVVSHQPGIAQGAFTAQQLEVLTRRFLLEVALSGGNIAKVYYCTHGLNDGCHCKSPQPGLLLRAKTEHYFYPADTYMISECNADLQAAALLGCPGILLRRDAFLANAGERHCGQRVASSLYEAVEHLLHEKRRAFVEPIPIDADEFASLHS